MGRCKAQRAIQVLRGPRANPAHRDLRARPVRQAKPARRGPRAIPALKDLRAKLAHRDLRANPAPQALPVPFLYSSVPSFPLPPQWR